MNKNSNWIRVVAGVFFWRGLSTKDSHTDANDEPIDSKHEFCHNYPEQKHFHVFALLAKTCSTIKTTWLIS